ncbi:hypothetical protein [Pseudoalteromonas piscicida]|uniref:Outer membrane protein beta-barrel domain-containing protein n=1 Tax=Pseudoalteromonas piscicida TaxID=43662 RepID=A0A2A5JPH7_PSEO7|nr:hypothetical protein [Pseudoalteromonas piscicida]PCK31374.1 hypothetical protein CEX98_12920 [Pseudoalteromonas piscicida]
MLSSLIRITVGVSALLCSASSFASSVDFSLGTGYPFLGQVELSVPQVDTNSRWFGNYVIGLGDGFAIGYEKAVSDNNKHALGLIAGAIGARDAGPVCEDQDDTGCEILEPFFDLFDSETTYGLGLSYSYYSSGINQTGWRVKLVAGYGESQEYNDKRVDGGLTISYQF